MEHKFETESVQTFLEYAKDWYQEFRGIRPAHKKRLVKIFAETDDRSSVYTPVCSMIYPIVAE